MSMDVRFYLFYMTLICFEIMILAYKSQDFAIYSYVMMICPSLHNKNKDGSLLNLYHGIISLSDATSYDK